MTQDRELSTEEFQKLTKQIQDVLARTDEIGMHAIGRALLCLHRHQTADEQTQEDTKYRNGTGFRPCHAKRGSSMATAYQRFGRLSPKQVAYWQRQAAENSPTTRIMIYFRQILEEALVKKGVRPPVKVTKG